MITGGNSWSTYRNDVSYKPPCLQCKLFCMNNKESIEVLMYNVAHNLFSSLALDLVILKLTPQGTMQYLFIFTIGEV